MIFDMNSKNKIFVEVEYSSGMNCSKWKKVFKKINIMCYVELQWNKFVEVE